jgi:hypothetical protein
VRACCRLNSPAMTPILEPVEIEAKARQRGNIGSLLAIDRNREIDRKRQQDKYHRTAQPTDTKVLEAIATWLRRRRPARGSPRVTAISAAVDKGLLEVASTYGYGNA